MSTENGFALTQSSSFLDKVYNRHLIPTMLMSIGVTLNVFFDGIIVGQTLGADSFAAVNLCMPIYLFMCTIGSLIGSGGFMLSSRAMGTGDTKKSSRIFNTVVVCMLVVSVLLTLSGLLALRPIVSFLAGGSELYQDVYAYTLITISGALPKLFLYIPLFYLRLDGKSRWASAATIVMTVSNILLDLLFVCVFEMGTGGAALASVLATLLACLIGIYALSGTEHFRFSFDFEKIRILPEVFRYGSPAAINNLMSALRVLVLNTVLLSAGGSIFVSVFSVLNNINEISLFIVDGVPQTAAPIIGMYCAEHSNEGIRILMKHQLKIGLTLSVIFGICISIFADSLGRIFGVTYEMRMPVICLAVSVVFVLVSRMMIGFYNASGKNVLSNILTAARLVVFPILALQIILGVDGLVWAFLPIAEMATLILLALILAVIHIRTELYVCCWMIRTELQAVYLSFRLHQELRIYAVQARRSAISVSIMIYLRRKSCVSVWRLKRY